MESIRDVKAREQVHPSLYFAVLAVSACDWGKQRAEPWTGVLETGASDSNTRLTIALRDAAISYLESSLASGEPTSISSIQAASALCILEPKRSPRKDALLKLIDSSILSMGLAEMAQDPPGFVQSYYSLPPRRESVSVELNVETAVRVCWVSLDDDCFDLF